MSLESKGSVTPTVTITCEPDRSGNYVSDGTSIQVELAAARDYVSDLGGGSIYIGAGSYTQTDDFVLDDEEFITVIYDNGASVTISLDKKVIELLDDTEKCTVYMPGSVLVPVGHSVPIISLRTATNGATCDFNKIYTRHISSSDQQTFDHIHLKCEGNTASSISWNRIIQETGWMLNGSRGLKLESIDGFINQNKFADLSFLDPTVGVEFIETYNISSNFFDNVGVQAGADLTHGFKDIDGNRNLFNGCNVWDVAGGQITANIAASATYTTIIGGLMTNLNFANLSSSTIMVDLSSITLPTANYLESQDDAGNLVQLIGYQGAILNVGGLMTANDTLRLGTDNQVNTIEIKPQAAATAGTQTVDSNNLSWGLARYPDGGPETHFTVSMRFEPYDKDTSTGVFRLQGVPTDGSAGAVSTYWIVEIQGSRYKIPLHALT